MGIFAYPLGEVLVGMNWCDAVRNGSGYSEPVPGDHGRRSVKFARFAVEFAWLQVYVIDTLYTSPPPPHELGAALSLQMRIMGPPLWDAE